jgi:hypothetical protein
MLLPLHNYGQPDKEYGCMDRQQIAVMLARTFAIVELRA